MSPPTRGELVLYVVCAAIIAVLGARALRAGGGDEAVDVRGRGAATTPTATGSRGASVAVERAPVGRQTIHVVGAVRRPGVYRLRDGERVLDAVRRAGGATAAADLTAVNLAMRVADGQQIIVPRRGGSGGAATTATAAGGAAGTGAAGGPVSLASATLEQLDGLDGVGPVTARKILEQRDRNGGFRSVDELADIPGIGPKRLERLRELVSP